MKTKQVCPTCEGTGLSKFDLNGKDIDQPDCGQCAGDGYLELEDLWGPDMRDNNIDYVRLEEQQ